MARIAPRRRISDAPIALDVRALAFVEMLARARDAAALFDALAGGLARLFAHHSLVASFDFERKGPGGARSLWTNRPPSKSEPSRPPEWWARNNAAHPGLRYALARPGLRVCAVSDVVPDDELDAHPYYREFIAPEGWRHALAILVWHKDELVGLVGINRSAAQGDFDDGERALATTLQPFVAATWERIADAQRLASTRTAHEMLLASLPIATLVVAPRTERVLFANRACREALARWRGESARKRPRAVSTRWLPREIAEACDDVPASGATVVCPRGGMRALLRRMDPRAHFESDVVLVVIEEDQAPTKRASPAWLRVARSLSVAELEVAKGAARGLSNADIARALGKSPLTVKKQLEAVFKTAGVGGRTQLAALYAGTR